MHGRNKLSGAIFGGLMLLSFHMCEPAALAAEAVKPAAAPSKPAQAANPAVNPITEAAVKAGALSCTGRINQITNFLTANSQSGAFLFTSPSQPDQRIFSASLEVQAKDGPTSYASMSVAPNQANGCGGLYETVTYWDKTPEELIKTQFPSLKRLGVIYKNIIMLDAGNVKIFIMPAGKGCVSIKKEVLQ